MPRNLHTVQRDLAHAMIRVYGNNQTGTLIKYDSETTNKISGVVQRTTLSRTALSMSLARFKERDVDGTNVRAQDRRFYISGKDAVAAGIVPVKGDEILADGTTWEILDVRPIKPSPAASDPTFFYKCHGREL